MPRYMIINEDKISLNASRISFFSLNFSSHHRNASWKSTLHKEPQLLTVFPEFALHGLHNQWPFGALGTP